MNTDLLGSPPAPMLTHPARGHAPSDLAAARADAIDDEVHFDDGARALYATDASNYRMPPIGVIVPMSRDSTRTEAVLALAVRAAIVGVMAWWWIDRKRRVARRRIAPCRS